MQCEFNRCTHQATKTWALVPLCEDHFDLIADETARHYKGEGGAAEAASRPCYMKIANFIPWSKLSLGKFDPKEIATAVVAPTTSTEPKKKRGRKRTHGTCMHCTKQFRLEFLAEHESHCKGAKRA